MGEKHSSSRRQIPPFSEQKQTGFPRPRPTQDWGKRMWLPSLRGLRSVEAALRLGSFAAAAKELGVTQTAISRLVKEVKRQLARPFFEWRANQSRPTGFALSLQSGLGEGFRRVESTVAEARRVVDDPTI